MNETESPPAEPEERISTGPAFLEPRRWFARRKHGGGKIPVKSIHQLKMGSHVAYVRPVRVMEENLRASPEELQKKWSNPGRPDGLKAKLLGLKPQDTKPQDP